MGVGTMWGVKPPLFVGSHATNSGAAVRPRFGRTAVNVSEWRTFWGRQQPEYPLNWNQYGWTNQGATLADGNTVEVSLTASD